MKGATKWVLGLAGLAVTVYVAGWAWKKSQDKSETVGFVGTEEDNF